MEGIQYGKTQAHLKPYHSQDKTSENELIMQNNHMWTSKISHSKQNTTNLAQSRPKRDIKKYPQFYNPSGHLERN